MVWLIIPFTCNARMPFFFFFGLLISIGCVFLVSCTVKKYNLLGSNPLLLLRGKDISCHELIKWNSLSDLTCPSIVQCYIYHIGTDWT